MKKLVLPLILIVLVLPCFLFAACDKDNSINMPRYFNSEVSYITYDKTNTKQTTTLDKFTGTDKTYRQYTNITFTGNTWLYKMTAQDISFDVCANMNMYVEFTITIANLKNGNNSASGGNAIFTKTVSVDLAKNKKSHIVVEINDYFASVSGNSEIKIVPDSACFYKNGQKTGFSYYLNNFMLHGSH